MWLSFALIILIATLFVIFADDVVNVFKKYWAISWFKLVVPLLVASYLFFEFELFIAWAFNEFEVILFNIFSFLASFFPKTTWAKIVIESSVILILTMAPIFAIDSWFFYKHKTKRLQNRYYIALLIWLFLAELYVSGMAFS